MALRYDEQPLDDLRKKKEQDTIKQFYVEWVLGSWESQHILKLRAMVSVGVSGDLGL